MSMSIVTKPLVSSRSNECLICEHSNDVEYWDTGRYLDLPIANKHEGRKYVCRDCVRDAAKLFGFMTPEDAAILQERNAYVEDQLLHANKLDDLVNVVNEAAATIALGFPGQAALAQPPVVESKPAKKSVKGAKIIQTVTPEADVTEDGREPVTTDDTTTDASK